MTYQHLLVRHDGPIAIATLNRPPANAIAMGMCNELIALLDNLEADDTTQGLILTGRQGMFSAGLDIIALRKLNRAAMALFWTRFCETFARLYGSPLSVAAAISGHAPAGGCVLALATDYRVMADGPYKIGLNEVAVGLPVPPFLCQVHAATVGQRNAERLLPHGTMVEPAQALALGLVDAVVETEQVLGLALKEVSRRLQAPPVARAATKLNLRRPMMEAFAGSLQSEVALLTDGWFSPECETVMGQMIAKLTRKK